MMRRPAARSSLAQLALLPGVALLFALALFLSPPALPVVLGSEPQRVSNLPRAGQPLVDEHAGENVQDAKDHERLAAPAVRVEDSIQTLSSEDHEVEAKIPLATTLSPTHETTTPPPSKPKNSKAQWRMTPKTFEFGNKSSDLPPILVAYCDYDSSRQWFHSNNYQEFLVEWLGPHLWPSRRVLIRNVYAKPRHLPSDIDPKSGEALDLLGITNTHLRICYFGNTEIIAHMINMPNIAISSIPVAQAKRRMEEAGLWTAHMDDRVRFSSARIQMVMNTETQKPFGPLLFRRSQETFGTGVHGVPVQIETKWEHGPSDSVLIYLPFLVDSFSWRWKNPNRPAGYWEHRVGAGFDTMKEAVTRPADYVPKLESRPYFVGSLVSHCEGNPFIPVREAFTFAVHQVTKKPVHNLGVCPDSDDGALLAGVSLAEREALRKRFRHASALEVFGNFKFAIVFENSFNRGYFTEKILNAYGAKTVPIYYSETFEDLKRVINSNAIIYCHMPRNLSDWTLMENYRKGVCRSANLKDETPGCSRAVRVAYKNLLFPYFEQCAKKIQEMDNNDTMYLETLAQPLAVLTPQGELGDMWSGEIMASFFRALLWGLGYVDP